MSGEGFLTRWSRRKRGAAEDAPPIGATPDEAPSADAPPQPPELLAAPGTDEAATPLGPAVPGSLDRGAEVLAGPAFDPSSLPPVESLTLASDLSAFLRPQVPAALRTAALRRLWTLDPAIRGFVGPAEYAWDYNAPDGGVAGFAPTLGGADVRRLLAQAVGLGDPESEPVWPVTQDAAETADGAPPPALADLPPNDTATLVATASAAVEEVSPPALSDATATRPGYCPVMVPSPAAPASVAPAPAASAQDSASPWRRHGGARPA